MGSKSQKGSAVWKYTLVFNILAVVAIISGVVFSQQHIFPFYDPQGIYPFLPGNFLLDSIWLYAITILIGVLIYFATPRLSLAFLRLHRLLRSNYEYHLEERTSSSEGNPIRRVVVPAFASLGIAVSLAESSIAPSIFVFENFENFESPQPAIEATFPVFFILLLVATVILLIFAPIWLLSDVGVICQRAQLDSRTTTNIEGVGDYYLKLLKGFAGVSTIIVYGLLMLRMFEWYGWVMTFEDLPFPAIVLLIPVLIALGGPVIAMGPLSLVLMFYETSLGRNVKALESRLEERGLQKRRVEVV
jgi:hypothetical protein